MLPGFSGSYRDLLGTAESIIEMDGQMQQVEATLGDLGRRCNTRMVERKGSNLRRLARAVKATGMGGEVTVNWMHGELI